MDSEIRGILDRRGGIPHAIAIKNLCAGEPSGKVTTIQGKSVRDTLPTACGASMWYGRQACVPEHLCIYKRPYTLDGEKTI